MTRRAALLPLLALLGLSAWFFARDPGQAGRDVAAPGGVAPGHDPPLRSEPGAASLPAESGSTARARLTGNPPPPRERLVVRVLGRGRIPVPGERVFVEGADITARIVGPTDSTGRGVLEDLPPGRSLRVRLATDPPEMSVSVPATATYVELRQPDVCALRVDLLDAETGHVLHGARWSTGPTSAGGQASTGETLPVRLQTQGARDPRECTRRLEFEVTPPDGYAVGDRTRFRVAVADAAHTLHVVFPIRRELPVRAVVVDKAGGRLGEDLRFGATLGSLWSGEPRVIVTGRREGHGWCLEGIPFFHGATYWIRARSAAGHVGRASFFLPPDHDGGAEVAIEIRARIDDSVETDNDLPFEESLGMDERAPSDDAASIRVRARRRDGSPAAGARVCLDGTVVRRTDAEGIVTFGNLRPGAYAVRLEEAGLLPVIQAVDITPGENAEVVLEEPRGASLEIRVVDEAGRPRPFARLDFAALPGFAFVESVAGVQRVDGNTDADGRRRFDRVQPGRRRILVSYGGQATLLRRDLVDGEHCVTTVVVK